ncbi:MAG: hypothetical protein K6G10_08875 [Butyrivibrio sp.]|nr:hypothetical protein [Butyrivibrio sp.]
MAETKQMLFARNLISLCIDEEVDGDYNGLIWHQYSDDPIAFRGLMDFVKKAEDLFDSWDFPQRGLAERSFDKKSRNAKRYGQSKGDSDKLQIDIVQDQSGTRNIQNKKGKLGTFVIQVTYRQNASWQGNVIHQESNEKKDFISELELIKMVDGKIQK